MANKSVNRWSAHGQALLAILGTLSVLWASAASGQEKGKTPKEAPAVREVTRLNTLVRVGYTRPGNPDDKIGKNGAILQVAHDPGFKGKIVGGTVYFAVFERLATPRDGDNWGTGMAALNASFSEGRSFHNSVSPKLDTKARYLYLYQVVNDRGLDPAPGAVAFAATNDIATSEIASFSLKLVVDPRYITSWGYFKGAGFTVKAPDRNIKGEVRTTAAGAEASVRVAVSSNPSVLGELPNKRFQRRSPAYSLGDLANSLGLGLSNQGLTASFNHALIAKKKTDKIALHNWEGNVLSVAETGGKEPQFVQLLTFGADDRVAPGVAAGDLAASVFRVDWKAAGLLKTGQNSVIFGFTSDLPPREEALRIDDAQAALKTDMMRVIGAAADGAGAGLGVGMGLGVAASPSAPRVDEGGGFAVGSPDIQGGLHGGLGGLGGGFGGFSGGVGALGAARPISSGGFGGGSGGGSGDGETAQQQTGVNDATNRGNQSQTLVFAASLNNQQAQKQSQSQFQLQTQVNRDRDRDRNGHGKVIPEPGAIVLGLVGLPALLLWRRRQKGQPVVETETTPA